MVFKWLPGAVTLLIENVTPSITARAHLVPVLQMPLPYILTWCFLGTTTSCPQPAPVPNKLRVVFRGHIIRSHVVFDISDFLPWKHKNMLQMWFLLEKSCHFGGSRLITHSPFRQPFSRFKSGNFCKTLSAWWLNQPIWKICSSIFSSFSQGSGWT